MNFAVQKLFPHNAFLSMGFLIGMLAAGPCLAQASYDPALQVKGSRYLERNIKSLDKYTRRLEQEQQRLLRQLSKQEKALSKKLQQTDSAAFAAFQQQTLSYDSIKTLQAAGSTSRTRGAVKAVDSLKAIQAFLQAQGAPADGAPLRNYSGELQALEQKLSYQQYISQLTDQRTARLKNLLSHTKSYGLFRGVEKKWYYAKEKAAFWKSAADEPDRAESEALEYLQGTPGFDGFMSKSMAAPGSLQALAGGQLTSGSQPLSADDLEKMGYQTKRQLGQHLEQQYGGSAHVRALQQQMGGQLKEWQDKANDVSGQVKEAKSSLRQLKQAGNPGKLSFKPNPMRGLPFWQRIEKQWSFQTTRAARDGSRPAMLEVGAMAGFRQTPSLSYGLGLAGSIGLGQDWSHMRLSFEGLGARSYAAWKWPYGFGAYAGYERLYKLAAFKPSDKNESLPNISVHNTSRYAESVLLGITKSYRINSRWQGAVQVLYDVWWQEKGMRSPILIRINNLR